MTPARTFPELLAQRLAREPAQPLLTAYDDATGERTELSATTYVNWVSKTANLLTDELGLDPGDTVLLDLPAHWLVPVFLGAAWTASLRVTTDASVPHGVVVCGPRTVLEHEAAEEVLACSLTPFATPFDRPLPPGVHDHGVMWAGQSDVFVPVAAPSPDTIAWLERGVDRPQADRTQADLLEEAAATAYPSGVRLLTDVHPARDAGVPALLAPLVHDGSVVLVRHPDDARWPARRVDERATEELREG